MIVETPNYDAPPRTLVSPLYPLLKDDFPGVYAVIQRTTGRMYIGSSRMVRARAMQHIRALYLGTHENSDMQKDADEYGVGSFSVHFLCTPRGSRVRAPRNDPSARWHDAKRAGSRLRACEQEMYRMFRPEYNRSPYIAPRTRDEV